MKLYHIDRLGTIRAGSFLSLNENIYFEDKIKNELVNIVLSNYFDGGLSQHGINYLINNPIAQNQVIPLSNMMDIIFEYERLLNYPQKLSRYQAFFAFDKEGVLEFVNKNNLKQTFFKIYEVESDYYEKYNMSLISGAFHYDISAMAKLYWENKQDPCERKQVSEYLLKYPIKIVKEVKLVELE